MSELSPDIPLVAFDADGYMYVFTSLEFAQNWLEPLSVDELCAYFDSKARAVEIAQVAEGYRLLVASEEAEEEALRYRVRRFIENTEPNLIGIAELPLPSMLNEIAVRWDVRKRPWKWRRLRDPDCG